MEFGKIRVIKQQEVESLLNMEQVLGLMEEVFKSYAAGKVDNPIKVHNSYRPYYDGYTNSMPSFLMEHNVMGIKCASCTKGNVEKGLPTTVGIILLFDPETGLPYATIDGTYITDVRTGAIAGVCAKYLARKDSKVLTIIGAGAQGFRSTEAICTAVPGIEEVRLVDINPAMIQRYLKKAEPRFPKVRFVPVADKHEACKGADVICACALSTKPLLGDIAFEKGTTVISVSDAIKSNAWMMETFDARVTDFPECFTMRLNQEKKWEAEKNGQTEYDRITVEAFDTTLGEVISGQKPGRADPDSILFAATVGMSMEDVICAKAVYDKAMEQGLGVEMDLIDIAGYQAGR